VKRAPRSGRVEAARGPAARAETARPAGAEGVCDAGVGTTKGAARSAQAAAPSKRRTKLRTKLRTVYVLGDAHKPPVRALLDELAAWLRARGLEVAVSSDVRAWCEDRARLDAAGRAAQHPDLVVVLGGDGAILAAARAFHDAPVPILGVNFGRVGFLAATPATRWQESLAAVLDGSSEPEPRMRLSAEIVTQGGSVRAVAMNEVVVQRGAHQGMLMLALCVDDGWVTNYRADGLIVATPSGSTAYSLSAGGPILAPHMQGIVITPICPQGLSNRPLVLGPESVLEVTLTQAQGLTTLVVDGQSFFQMRQGDHVRIQRHALPYPLLAMPDLDPYRRLRERLGWRGSIEEQEFTPPQRRERRRDAGVDSL
jgi:NAD+ kinase